MQNLVRNKTLGIIGGKGKMAKWFLFHFKSFFKKVYIHDVASSNALKSFCNKCDIILVTVPIDKTIELLLNIKKYLREEQVIIDFCSLKEKVCKTLKKLPCKSIGLHPLFGPNSHDLNELTIAMCPVSIGREKSFIINLLKSKGMKVLLIDAKLHDQIMAYVQALNQISILSFGSLLKTQNKKHLLALATPSFKKTHLSLISILKAHPELYMNIAFENPYFLKIFEKFQLEIQKIYAMIAQKDSRSFKRMFNSQKKFWEES